LSLNTQCGLEHQKLLSAKTKARFNEDFSLNFWQDTTSDSLIKMLKDLNPQYVHYCGHGNADGEFIVRGHKGRTVSFRANTLAKYLRQNPRLECVIFCSCNSANLVEEIKAFSNYAIGFTGEVDNLDMHQFTEDFYEELFQLGSPFNALLNTIDKIKERRQLGNSIILRTKLNHIMERTLYERLSAAQANAIAVENEIQLTDRLLEQAEGGLASAGQAYSVDFKKVMVTHPTPDEVIWFSSAKDQLALEAAKVLYRKKNSVEIEDFANELKILYLSVETALVYFQENETIRENFISAIDGSEYPIADFINALDELKYLDFGFNPSENFKTLYERTIELGKKILLNSH